MAVDLPALTKGRPVYTLYNLLQFVHIVAAIVWLGAGVTFFIINGRLAAAKDADGLRTMTQQAEFFGPRVFSVAAVTTLVAGVWMVIVADTYGFPWGFADAWISWGFTGVVLSIVFGAVLTERTSKALGEAAETEDPDSPTVTALQRRLATYSAIDIVILLSVVWAMVFKPGA